MSSKQSETVKRQIQVYPAPKYHGLLLAKCKADEVSRSEVVNQAVKEYFDRMPEQEIQRIKSLGSNHY
jgi:hypothetical protein